MQIRQNNYAFIDSQNLNLSIRSQGWILDWKRFRIYLKEKYSITKAFLFIGYISQNQNLYESLKKDGYILIFKPTLKYKDRKQLQTKGNVDAELVLHSAAIEYPNYDKAIVVSGDGDFYCLLNYLEKQNKLLRVCIPNRKKYSILLRKFRRCFVYLTDLKKKLGRK